MLGMDELLIFNVEGTADWRDRLASEYPHDAVRNLAAAELLTQLAQGLRSLEGTTLHKRLDALLTSDIDGTNAFHAIISQATRDVGFRKSPDSADSFLEELVQELEQESAHSRQDQRSHSGTTAALRRVRTPRFPEGITIGGLRTQSIPVQMETMAFWFLGHYHPAVRTHFGFTDANEEKGSPSTTLLTDSTPGDQAKIRGLDQGIWFYGGRALDLLTAVFQVGVGPGPIQDVAAMFDGLWEMNQTGERAAPDPAHITAAIANELGALESSLEALAPQHGGIGHNGPRGDELPITRAERGIVLNAVSEMRLALASQADPSVLDSAWSATSGITAKLGAWALQQIHVFFENFTPAAGKALADKLPYFLLIAAAVYYHLTKIEDLIAMLIRSK